MLDWGAFKVILAIGTEGSLSAAARSLDVNQATVGRQLKRAEVELGSKLFDRMSNGLFPTKAGITAIQYAQQIEQQVNLASRSIKGADQSLEGVLRFSVPNNLMEFGIAEIIRDFHNVYPHITFDITTTDELLNFSDRGVDVVIRAQNEPSSGLWGYQISKLTYRFIATQSYWDRWGSSIEAKSITAPLPYISLSLAAPERDEMQLLRVFPAAFKIADCVSLSSVIPMIETGIGTARVPHFVIPYLSDVRTVVECDESSNLSLWILTHRDFRQSKRIRLFMEFVRERFAKTS